ncbi:pilin [Actinoalloteichus caeruleus]|uniref:pilin n=1 Tax=Actinoalloteichus cyanogriseus TaxID=2893586 RepID=UPI003BB89F0A
MLLNPSASSRPDVDTTTAPEVVRRRQRTRRRWPSEHADPDIRHQMTAGVPARAVRRATVANAGPLAVVGLVAVGLSVFAVPATATETVVAQAQSVDEVLNNIRDWLMGILAGLATVFLSIGGVRYVMAAGDPGEVEKAKTAFKSAGWGYGLAVLAPLVVEILRGIVGA